MPDLTSSGSIPARFAAWVDAAPERAAVVDVAAGVTLSYAQLDADSARAAAHLDERAVRSGDVVAVSLELGAGAAAAMMGALRLGAGVAALDPRWPAPRRAAILAALRPALLVEATASDGSVAAGDLLAPTSAVAPAVSVDPTATAAVFFTSGSSGEAKMVASPHQALTRLVGADRTLFREPGAVMLQASRPGWDVVSLELWAPLCSGGTSHIRSGGVYPDAVVAAVAAGVDHAWITSSVLNLLIDEDVECLRGLRRLLTGGEVLSPPHVARLRDALPELELVNGYGPVEACVFATTHVLDVVDPAIDVPIGAAVSDTEIVLVGPGGFAEGGGEPVEGEIWIGGTGLASEYLGDPELTAHRFVVAGTPPRRFYRTGDRGRRDAADLLHFGGRLDRQVKVRGARVQPEELEFVAGALTSGRCRALPVPGRWSGYDRLALFVTDAASTPAELRRELAARLPKHLVPDVIRHVDRLPVTTNGKVDDRALLSILSSPADVLGPRLAETRS